MKVVKVRLPLKLSSLLLLTFLALSSACSPKLPTFSATDQPAAPDYANPDHWCALPFREDAPDIVPYGETPISDSLKKADVFYIYPTLYSKGKTWNADLDDHTLNKRIDNYPVRLQAGVFSQTCRVYAPRYRQSHLDAFDEDPENGPKALEFAYQDVARAFQYYLDHYNQGRPIVIAGHSQGTWQARRLIKDFFDTPATKKQLVCAYLVGYAIHSDDYTSLTLRQQPNETQCYVTWSSFQDGYLYPKMDKDLLVGDTLVNPLTWTTAEGWAQDYGGIFIGPEKEKRHFASARIEGDMLWVRTELPYFGDRKENKHLVDYNLFWDSIRENVAERVGAFLGE